MQSYDYLEYLESLAVPDTSMLSSLIERFMAGLRKINGRPLSALTRQAHLNRLKQFHDWARLRGLSLEQVSLQEADQFCKQLTVPATRYGFQATIRRFLKWRDQVQA